MSTKRQPSKQRRQTQNQKQRAALSARREAAAASAAPPGKDGGTSHGSASGTPRGSVLSRLRGATPRRPPARAGGRAPAGSRTGNLPVGHRAALSAVFAAVAGAVVGSLLFRVPVDRSGDAIVTPAALVAEWSLSAAEAARDLPDATSAEIAAAVTDWSPAGTEPYALAFWPISAAVLLPVLGTGLGLRAVSRRSPAKLVNRTMYITLFGSLLASQLMLVFLPAVVSLAIAAFQVRKAEVQAGATASAEAPGDQDVIEVDEVAEAEAPDPTADQR